MALLLQGTTYHQRRCRKCGNIFHTTSKYTNPAVCYNCADNKGAIKAIPEDEWFVIKERWNRMNCKHKWKFCEIERRGNFTWAYYTCIYCPKCIRVQIKKLEDEEVQG